MNVDRLPPGASMCLCEQCGAVSVTSNGILLHAGYLECISYIVELCHQRRTVR